MRILVVDDNRDSADALAWLLQSIGHEARAAYDGPSALLAVERHSPEVVIQDLGMPDMSGYEVAEEIRKLGWKGSLIALSGYGQESDKTRSRETGFDQHLVKPVGIDDILKTLSTVKK